MREKDEAGDGAAGNAGKGALTGTVGAPFHKNIREKIMKKI